jgi:4-hydroxymandelate oxidase
MLTEAELGRIVNVSDFEPIARANMAAPAFNYVAGGGWDEVTLGEASLAWERYRFIPRVLRDVRATHLNGSFLGRTASLPIAIPPMAAQAMGHPDGEIEMARGALRAGIPMTVSTPSSFALEAVAESVPAAHRFFQLYLVGDLGYSLELVDRAGAAGYEAILLTVDLPVPGYRDRDRRSGFEMPPIPMVDAAPRPISAGPDKTYGGVDRQREIGLSWSTLEVIRARSKVPVFVKGVLSSADAELALEAGVDGIIVSTHGGRQLDRVISSAQALPPIVATVAGRCPVWVDGGIRRGLDVAVALALGADAVLVGRPFYWALAAAGASGVARAAAILREELHLTLTLLGCTSVAELDPSLMDEAAAR